MIYRKNTRRFVVPALLLALVLFGISPFTSGASAPAVPPAAPPLPSPVAGWGNNDFGQLNIPNDATAISAGFAHNLALKSDGTVVGWGTDLSGTGAETPPAGLTGVTAISAGPGVPFFGSLVPVHSLALKSDGTVVGWGNNSFGQVNIPAGLSGVVAIAAGGTDSLALKSDGTVVGWGTDLLGSGAETPPAGLTGVTAIAAGGVHSLALKSDGTVVSWGTGNEPPAGLSGVVAIAAGFAHSLALKSDGTVVAWGGDTFGAGVLNVPAGLSNVVAISASIFHNLALKSDGTVVGWGFNSSCESTPPSCITGVTAIAAGGGHSLTLQAQSCVQVGCSPQQDLSAIIAQIQALVAAGTLTQNQGAGLIDKINQTIVKLDSGQTAAACNQLNSFINQVNAFISSGALTSSQGQSLIDGANGLKADIGCP